jgi:hypothetical protein
MRLDRATQHGLWRHLRGWVICLTAASSFAVSANTAERWTAVSTTASSITGNVRFSDRRIGFFNGKALNLVLQERASAFTNNDQPLDVTIYRVTKPLNLKLKNGNWLCGNGKRARPATFIVVWKPELMRGDLAPRALAVFSGDQTPSSTANPASCGVYYYEAE